MFDRLYGLDQELVNGIRYIPEYAGSQGHPFLADEAFQAGTLILDQGTYRDVRLAYDIYNQHVLLEYTGFTGAPDQIILRSMHIRGFSLGSLYFEHALLEDGKQGFFQYLEEGSVKCYFYWYKNLRRSGNPGESFYGFSDPKRKFYLEMEGQIRSFKGTRQFIRLFPEGSQPALRRYIRQNHLRIRWIGDPEMSGLLRFCNQLIPQ